MVSIARKNLFEDIPRFLVAQAGIMFAVSLVTIQTGILNGFTRSTVLLIENSTADLWMAAREMENLELTQPIPAERVTQAQQVEGVARAEALAIQSGRWISPSGDIASVRIIGYDPAGQLFRLWNVTQGSQADIRQPYSLIVDEANLKSLGFDQVGEQANIGAAPARLVGLTKGTQSIASSAFVFTSLENTKAYATAGLTSTVRCRTQAQGGVDCTTVYERLQASPNQAAPNAPAISEPQPLNANDPIAYVLVKAEAGQDVTNLQRRLNDQFPNNHTYTRAEMANITRDYWQRRTGIGFVLGLGATVGIIVGVVIVGQILYSSVSDNIKEFGTLKAMGASDWIIYRVIIEQALWMAILGYIPSIGLCLGLGTWTFATQGIMILITPISAAGIFAITVGMCVGSAIFAIQKVTHVDPAIVFKA
ncbi:ABC transporter permease [Oculatella sp. LEGE 06141]|nr:ABC transporter permease [Oculatella sp. LEGE 06141]